MPQYKVYCNKNIDTCINIAEEMGFKEAAYTKELPFDLAILFLSRSNSNKEYSSMKKVFIRNHVPFVIIYN